MYAFNFILGHGCFSGGIWSVHTQHKGVEHEQRPGYITCIINSLIIRYVMLGRFYFLVGCEPIYEEDIYNLGIRE